MASSVSNQGSTLTTWANTQEKLRNAATGALFLHVSDLFKTTQQDHPDQSFRQTIRTAVFKHHHSVFTAALPNYTRRTLKDFTRWTFIEKFRNQITNTCPDIFPKNGALTRIAVGTAVAGLDASIFYPLDYLNGNRVKLGGERVNYFVFITKIFREKGMKGFYAGAESEFVRGSIGMSCFLLADLFSKRIYDQQFPEGNSYIRQFCTALTNAGAYTLTAQPLDMIKFRKQTNPHFQKMSIFRVGREIYQQEGLQALRAGWQIVALTIMIRSMVWGSFVDKVMGGKKT